MSSSEKIPERKYIDLGDGYGISYREYGQGKPVIAIPPWMTSSIVFYPISKKLNEIKLICPDIPGWGNDLNSDTELPHVDFYIDVIEKFIQILGMDNIDMVGYSYGGVIAQGIVLNNKVKVKRLALISSLNGGFHVFNERKFKLIIRSKDRLWELSKHLDLLKKLYIFGSKIHIAFSYRDNSNTDFVEVFLDDMHEISMDDIMGSVFSLYGRTFLSPKLFDTDLLLIYAEKDHGSVKKGMKDIAEYTSKKLIKIPKHNHHHTVFKPELAAKYLNEFLN